MAPPPPPPPPHRHLFHLVQLPLWRAAQQGSGTYYPPTYEQDGFVHLTADPALLLGVANQFYRGVPAEVEWAVLVLDAAALAAAPGAGPVKYEPAAPVGNIPAREGDAEYPHLYGGIPASDAAVVLAELPVARAPGEGGEFLSIGGLEAWGG